MQEIISKLPISPNLQAVVGVCSIVVLTFAAAWVVRAFVFVFAKQLAGQTETDLDDRLLKATRKHTFFLVYLMGAFALFNLLEGVAAGTALTAFRYVDGVLWTITVGLVASLLVRISSTVLRWFGENVASKTETTVDDEFLPLAERAVKVIVYILAVLIVLEHFDVDIKGLIAVLGIGSLAIALAAQETIANMIGGFVIMIDRPFRKGDRVRLDDGTVCVVHAIGIRSTKFWTFENTLIIVPNADLMKSTIHNITYPFPQVRVRVDVGVGYHSDMDHVKAVMLDEAAKHELVLKDPAPSWYLLEFGDSSLNVSLRCHVADVSDQFVVTAALREQILGRFRQENIEIPFPQRVLTMVDGQSTAPFAAKTAKPTQAVSSSKPKPDGEANFEDG
ncbi:MAG: mechanosensitive ion channel domain-containing protein [bacterium]